MRIILIGYGKMGKEIERIATDRGHEVVSRIDIENQDDLMALTHKDADVAIEFSNPIYAFSNIMQCIKKQIPIVCGTTGWLSQKAEVEKATYSFDSTFFYASNYSIGVNLFFKFLKILFQ